MLNNIPIAIILDEIVISRDILNLNGLTLCDYMLQSCTIRYVS